MRSLDSRSYSSRVRLRHVVQDAKIHSERVQRLPLWKDSRTSLRNSFMCDILVVAASLKRSLDERASKPSSSRSAATSLASQVEMEKTKLIDFQGGWLAG